MELRETVNSSVKLVEGNDTGINSARKLGMVPNSGSPGEMAGTKKAVGFDGVPSESDSRFKEI